MGLAATYVMLIPLLLSLFAAMPPANAILKTSNITAELENYKTRCDYFNTHKLGKAFQVDLPTTMHNDALQVTLDSVNSDFSIINQTGRILYESPFKLWEGRNELASFYSSFPVNLHRVDNSTPHEGLTFAFLGDIDPNSNHVGLNIESVRSNITTSLTTLGLQLVGEGTTANFFNVWVQYEGIKKLIGVYVAQQNETDLTPCRPVNPILTSYLYLRGVENLNLNFAFSASKENATQLNRVRQWNLTLTVVYNHDVNWLKIGLIVGITTAVLLPASVALVYYSRKRWLSRRSDRQMSRKVKSMPGMPMEYRYKDLQKATNNFDETRKLGQGGCGVVYKGYLANQQDLEVAVKMFSRESLKGQDDFFQELTIINQLRHKYLVPLLGQLLEAVDNRLGENNVAEEAQRFLRLGLACSHPTASERPKTQEIVQMLSGSAPVPYVPPFRPPYMLPLVPTAEEDISQATTTDTTSFMTAHYGSGSAPVAINPKIQRPDSDSHINIV